VPASQIRAGDVLLLDDGSAATVTDVRGGQFWMPAGRADGVAIGWKAGTALGVLLRQAGQTLHRLPAEDPGQAAR